MFDKATNQTVSGFGCMKKIYESETLNSAKLTRLKEQARFFFTLFGLRLKDSILTYNYSF